MKFISKNKNSGACLVNKVPPDTSAKSKARWKRFNRRNILSKELMEEQCGLCAYSEIVPENENLGTHIEHVVPKSLVPNRTFDVTNLIVSALSSNDLKSMNSIDYFGGHAKENGYDSSLFISCLDNNCSQYFSYISNGLVEAKRGLTLDDQEKAIYTIKLLNLNSPYLATIRKNWINEIELLIEENLDDDLALDTLAKINLLSNEGVLSPFYSATLQRFGSIGDKVLA
jgi:uncharacterized protein (TIGR02646 family)